MYQSQISEKSAAEEFTPFPQQAQRAQAGDHFSILNRLVGKGEPYGILWFIGPGDLWEWTPETVPELETHARKQFRVLEYGEIARQAKKSGKTFTKAYDIMSKILVSTLQIGFRWKEYRDRTLFQHGSRVFFAHLYPLGKEMLEDCPGQLKTLFGVNPDEQDRYASALQERSTFIRELWTRCSPSATVCYGVSSWDRFIDLLDLREEPYREAAQRIRVYRDRNILLTPFFDYRQMSQKNIEAVTEILKDFLPLERLSPGLA